MNTEAGVDKFDAMQIFVRVIEKGSFSAVAKERGIGQPAVSKQISALEDELGTELIHRTSRSIALTEAGRDFYESALHILDDLDNATSRGFATSTPAKSASGFGRTSAHDPRLLAAQQPSCHEQVPAGDI
jgi:LysR family transcriptional regulator for bpeEF and oprC